MTITIDRLFARRVGSRLDKFEEKSEDKFVFRCCYCGDSTKDAKKRRGAFINIESSLIFKCKNCGKFRKFSGFLKDNDPGLYSEYLLEKYEDQNAGRRKVETIVQPEPTQSLREVIAKPVVADDDWMSQYTPLTPLGEMIKLSEHSATHPGVKYLYDRGITPKNRGFKDFLWTDNFGLWAHVHGGRAEPKRYSDPRVVAPMISRNGVELGAQGRAIDPKAGLKYLTAVYDKSYLPCYGAHAVNFSDEIWVCEGVYDSLAFENALAGLHSDLSGFALQMNLNKSKTVLVFDNEPGNPDVKREIKKAISRGFSIAFWKYPQYEVGKDSASAILENGHKKEELFRVCQGLSAELEMSSWSGQL